MTGPFGAVLVLLAVAGFVASPYLAGAFGGFEPSQFPVPQDRPPVQPAGYAFAIWGLIYLWLVVHAVAGLVLRPRDPAWAATRWPLILSTGIGAVWIPVAQRDPLWATAVIWVMLIAALAALLRTPARDRWLLRVPLALYAGWLTAASSVSVGLIGAGYGLWVDQTAWAWIALGIGLALAALVQIRLGKAPEYAVAVAWALVAVAVRNYDSNLGLTILGALGAVNILALSLIVPPGSTRRPARAPSRG